MDKTTRVPQTVQGTLPQCKHFHQHEVMTATFFLVTTLFYQYYKIRHTLDFAQRQEGLFTSGSSQPGSSSHFTMKSSLHSALSPQQ